MILTDAQKVVERVFDRVMMLPYGVEVTYAPICKRRYIVNVNDWSGAEVRFALSNKHLLDSEIIKSRLAASFIRLQMKRKR